MKKRGGNNTPRARRRLFTLPLAGRGSRAGGASRVRGPSRVHKPHLDEMHGPESLPYRPGGARPRKPSPETSARQRQQNLPAHRLAPIRPGIRPRPPLQRRRAGASRRVEEEVAASGAGNPTGSATLAL